MATLIRALLLIALGGALVVGAALWLPKPQVARFYQQIGFYDTALELAYAAKLENPFYSSWERDPEDYREPQKFPEEYLIKQIRAAATKNVRVPKQVRVHQIPLTEQGIPTIDGVLTPKEWSHALQIPIGQDRKSTALYLQSDGKWLYIGCDAIDDQTASGLDQFRFYLHVNVIPSLLNERIHVRKVNNQPSLLRSIRSLSFGSPAISSAHASGLHEDIMPDWAIYQLAIGASTFTNHRQYEAAINLEEAGLKINSPFPAFVEVETDPIRNETGGFLRRDYIGRFGRQEKPAWFTIRR